jgi:putative hydrolase of HD superfamily
VTVDSARILRDQLEDLPFSDLHTIALEYELRESRESIVAKDADTIDQILLLREYAMQGNREAQLWLDGKTENRPYNYVKRLVTDSGKALGKAIYDESPSSWALKK